MATALSQVVMDAYQKWRISPTKTTKGTLYSGTVSELVTNDFVYGVRAVVTATPTVSGANHVVSLSRLGQTFTVTWPSAQTIYFER